MSLEKIISAVGFVIELIEEAIADEGQIEVISSQENNNGEIINLNASEIAYYDVVDVFMDSPVGLLTDDIKIIVTVVFVTYDNEVYIKHYPYYFTIIDGGQY